VRAAVTRAAFCTPPRCARSTRSSSGSSSWPGRTRRPPARAACVAVTRMASLRCGCTRPRFRTVMCDGGTDCPHRICFFAHCLAQRRREDDEVPLMVFPAMPPPAAFVQRAPRARSRRCPPAPAPSRSRSLLVRLTASHRPHSRATACAYTYAPLRCRRRFVVVLPLCRYRYYGCRHVQHRCLHRRCCRPRRHRSTTRISTSSPLSPAVASPRRKTLWLRQRLLPPIRAHHGHRQELEKLR
jgi:hypothetical protein